MKDSQNTEFGVNDTLHSNQVNIKNQIRCIAIKNDVAEFEWQSSGDTFKINSYNMIISNWVKD